MVLKRHVRPGRVSARIVDVDSKGLREYLRGAVARRDGATLVRLLTEQGWPPESMQLVGDGLLDAVRSGVPGAAEEARRCAGALQERGWSGDDLLAGALAAAVGGGPDPGLRPVAVDLDQLGAALEASQSDSPGRLNLITGEVWPPFDPDYADIEDEEDEEDDEGDSDDWLPVHGEGSRAGYRDMEVFIAGLDQSPIADRLDAAIHQTRAFRRFKDILSQWPTLMDVWYAFSEERRLGRARSWLADQGYTPADISGAGGDTSRSET